MNGDYESEAKRLIESLGDLGESIKPDEAGVKAACAAKVLHQLMYLEKLVEAAREGFETGDWATTVTALNTIQSLTDSEHPVGQMFLESMSASMHKVDSERYDNMVSLMAMGMLKVITTDSPGIPALMTGRVHDLHLAYETINETIIAALRRAMYGGDSPE